MLRWVAIEVMQTTAKKIQINSQGDLNGSKIATTVKKQSC
jgi:hypothetical protein